MNIRRGLSLVMLGAGMAMAYQSMNTKTRRKINGVVQNMAGKANDKLDDMM